MRRRVRLWLRCARSDQEGRLITSFYRQPFRLLDTNTCLAWAASRRRIAPPTHRPLGSKLRSVPRPAVARTDTSQGGTSDVAPPWVPSSVPRVLPRIGVKLQDPAKGLTTIQKRVFSRFEDCLWSKVGFPILGEMELLDIFRPGFGSSNPRNQTGGEYDSTELRRHHGRTAPNRAVSLPGLPPQDRGRSHPFGRSQSVASGLNQRWLSAMKMAQPARTCSG